MMSLWVRPSPLASQAATEEEAERATMRDELEKRGIVLDPRRMLAGGQEFTFHGPPPRVGERLTTSARFDGYEVKEGRRGGSMTFVYRTTEFRDEKGDLRLESKNTAIYTSAPPSQG